MREKLLTHKAIQKWLLVLIYTLLTTGALTRINAEERGMLGGYVDDPVITVPANSYTTFSTVYNGKRYYLGVDTTAAKSGVDTIAIYDKPCYAAMWIAGPMWSPTGQILPNKDYTRTVKSVYLAELVGGAHKCYLSVGSSKRNYSPLVLTDTLQSTMWHTAKDMTVQSQYMHGYTYAYSDESGVEIYRYMNYDPVYGFSRLYEVRPTVSQRISVWDRTTGDDVVSVLTPDASVFDLSLMKDHITSQVQYYPYIDRFRSRFDQMDIYARLSDPVDDQAALIGEPYSLYGYYEWASNPRDHVPTKEEVQAGDLGYDGKSIMKHYGITNIEGVEEHPDDPSQWVITYGQKDSAVMQVFYGKFVRDDLHKIFHDTIFAVGSAPYDIHEAIWNEAESKWEEGPLKEHSDWLRQHFYIKPCADCPYEHFVDSILMTRHTYTASGFTNVSTTVTPADHVFPYTYDDKLADGTPMTESDVKVDFTISADFSSGYYVNYIDNSNATTVVNEEGDLNLNSLTDQQLIKSVECVLADGTTNAIVGGDGSSAESWVKSVEFTANNTIHVEVNQCVEDQSFLRVAQIRVRYTYNHSSVAGDVAEVYRTIWITQNSKNASSAALYSFYHKYGKGFDEAQGHADAGDPGMAQPVHTKRQILYAIPEENLQLPIHRDYWGYYRWYKWRGTDADGEKDVENGLPWSFVRRPKNALNGDFMPINPATDGASRGQWDIINYDNQLPVNHFNVGVTTAIPVVRYPVSSTMVDTIACDVSAYTDINTHGSVIGRLSELTEPTLSYRHIFEIRPAKEQADRMSNCRVNGGWMEEYEVLVPAGSAFTLQQQYPVVDHSEDVVEESHLQYIYYFNPSPTGTEDPDMGVKIASEPGDTHDNHAKDFARIGETKYSGTASVSILDAQALRNMEVNETKTVLMVNPMNIGYVLGNSKGTDKVIYGDFTGDVVDQTTLEALLNSYYLAPENKGAYTLTLTKTSAATSGNVGIFRLTVEGTNRHLTSYFGVSPLYGNTVRWPEPIGIGGGTNEIQIEVPYSSDREDVSPFLVKDRAKLFRLYMSRTLDRGYIAAFSSFSGRTFYYGDNDVDLFSWNNIPGPADGYYKEANGSWCFFEINTQTAHTETPKWYMSTTGEEGSWGDPIAEEGKGTSGYRMLPDGSLHVEAGVLTIPTTTTYYCLRTEHFNLAKFAVWNTDPTTDGPSDRTILSEDSIQNHFDILFTLGNDLFPSPNTSEARAFYHHMPWDFTELAYHYPVGEGEHHISATNRTYSDLLPARGEYAYINKFIDPTDAGNVVEAMSGAEHGYMMCINVSQRPITIFDFEYPGMPCSDQNIYLTANICNPVNNSYRPQITADLEGWDGSTWTMIYRYKTGEIPYNSSNRWYQLVLPINQINLRGYTKFRCIALMHGSTAANSYVLIDRMRFIAKERPLNIFQNKASCLEQDGTGKVDIIARLDYQNATYPEGTHFAYQYQKKVGDAFVALETAKYSCDLTGFEMKDINNKSCGVITIPAKTYTPTAPGDTIVPASGITTHLKTYVNEGTAEHTYYVMYISQQVDAIVGDTFRVAMTTIPNAATKPDFEDAGCATERLIPIHNPVELHVNGSTGDWPNYTRDELTGSDEAHTLRPANETYTVTATIGDRFLPSGYQSGSGKCMFDVVRTMADDRGYGADEWFRKRFGCTREQFRDIMTIFRADDDRNQMCLETNWNNVRPEMFQYSGRTKQQADSMYTILNRLIVDSAFVEIGKSSYDIYMGENNNAYVVLWPIPASGNYIEAATSETKHVSVCSTPRWFEIHSAASTTASLRLGYDNMFEGDYYILPVVRASSVDANSSLKVRVAEITHEDNITAILGWDATTIVESNDPKWNSETSLFRYRQDKDARMDADPHVELTNYYYAGGTAGKSDTIVTFTPLETNNFTLKGGYWYKFRVPFYRAEGTTFQQQGDPVGHTEFVLAVAPDTVRWVPSHPDQTNYWNDDNNWEPIMANKPADGFKARVPMNGTNVIIPQTEEGQLPVVSEFVVNNQDLRDFGYQKNTCEKILFKPRAQMLGQEKLTYTKAYVDVLLKTGEWQTFSPALEDIYAGDMYIPFSTSYNFYNPASGNSVDTVDFDPKPFPYQDNINLNYNPREYPFAFYQGFYNAAVPVPYYNTDTEDKELTNDSVKSKSAVDWVRTPSMSMQYKPGAPCVIQGYDAYDVDGNEIVVRLPKSETTYYGYGKYQGDYLAGGSVSVERSHPTHNLAYDWQDNPNIETEGISYTLKNLTAADLFFFGNPTMALVDVYKLCVDNSDVLKHDGSNYYFTAYQLVDGSSYTTRTITGPGQYFIAPQRAIGLIASDARQELTITLKPSALVAITGEGSVVNNADIASPAPRKIARTRTVYEEPDKKWLYITASNETDWGIRKSYLTLGEQRGASRGYIFGEDALNIASGLNYYDDGSFSTPLSLYTIADNKALMQDVRDSLVSVPVVFTTLPDYTYSEFTMLSFSMDGPWDKPLYLYDALTNDSVLIRNGLQIAVQTPNSDQIRYFINGHALPKQGHDQGVTTDLDGSMVNDPTHDPTVDDQTVQIYDMLGRKVMTLTEFDLLFNIQLPTGVYVIQRGTKTERMVVK